MALKDWKEIRNGWRNEKRKEFLLLFRPSTLYRTKTKDAKLYWVEVNNITPPDFRSGPFIVKKFKTKPQALKFAMAYMRTH